MKHITVNHTKGTGKKSKTDLQMQFQHIFLKNCPIKLTAKIH